MAKYPVENPIKYPMKQLATAVLAMALCGTAPSGAQTTPPPNTGPTSATTANPELQRQLAPSQRAMKKQRRAACEKQFAQQRRLSHYRFMRKCLKG